MKNKLIENLDKLSHTLGINKFIPNDKGEYYISFDDINLCIFTQYKSIIFNIDLINCADINNDINELNLLDNLLQQHLMGLRMSHCVLSMNKLNSLVLYQMVSVSISYYDFQLNLNDFIDIADQYKSIVNNIKQQKNIIQQVWHP